MTVEVIGRSCVAAGAENTSDLLTVLKERRCTVSKMQGQRWEQARFWHPKAGTQGKAYTFAAGVIEDIYNFDPDVFGLSKREASYMDPQQRILLQLVWRALEDAALAVETLQQQKVGVYVGVSNLDSANLYSEDPASGGPYFMTGNTMSIVANRISHIFGLQGPSMTIDTACSSSLVALDQAVKALQRGEIDTAIVGGINLLTHPFAFVGFSQARMLSPEGLCRAYGEGGQGYVRAEGGGAIVLRRSHDALQSQDRSYATIITSGVNSAGRTNGISLPSREAQAKLLNAIYGTGEIDLDQLAFIEGHGTGTAVGDPAEVWALGTAIGQKRKSALPIGSIKSNIGHAEPASGLLGLIKAILALENDFIPATLHADVLNKQIDFDDLNIRVNTEPTPLLRNGKPRLAGVNSFGFGGTNAHIVISDPQAKQAQSTLGDCDDGSMFVVSAHTAQALQNLLDDYRQTISSLPPEDAKDVATAAYGHRTLLRHRFVVPSVEPADVLAAIDDHIDGASLKLGQTGISPATAAKIAFVYTGNGSQWAGMGKAAFQHNDLFRKRYTHISALFEAHLGQSLVELMQAPHLDELLADTTIAQPMLFAVQAAISDCLIDNGIVPAAVYGHSVGELAAAYASGILSAEEAVKIVAIRSHHQHALAGTGTMVAAMQTQDAFETFAAKLGLTRLSLAAVNAQNSITIAGPHDDVQAYRDEARQQNIVASVLNINYPFHHPAIDQVKDDFLAALPEVKLQPGNFPFISTVHGRMVTADDLDPNYWWSNVREPVRFQAGTDVALDEGCNLFIEISPRAILQTYIVDTAKHRSLSITVLPSLGKTDGEDGQDPIRRIIAQLIANGASSSKMTIERSRNASIRLPQLPFDVIDLRPPRTSDRVDIYGRDAAYPYTLLGWQVDPKASSWKNHVDARLFPDLAEHVVDGKAILPGSGFIDIAIGAAQRFYGTDDVEITNLEILRPLELQEKSLVELSTNLSAETGYIEIRSRDYLSEDDWTIHAVARSRKPIKQLGQIAVDFANEASTTSLSARSTYAAAKQFGLSYGPNFQLLQEATAYGRRFVEVSLREPAKPAHPDLAYNLHPISVDAAFHGLVALFGELSGEAGGAPYIPVRFGSIRMRGNAPKVARALIEIQRFSAYSIKARFCLFDEAGRQIATLDDCRFRRTYLRKHKSLETLGFHYQAIPAAKRTSLLPYSAKTLLGEFSQQPAADSLLLLDAAVYRASYDIAAAFASSGGEISEASLPAHQGFRAFVTSCLFTLEDAQLITGNGGTWEIPASVSLPSVKTALKRLYRDHPDVTAETVLLNDAYTHAMETIAALQANSTHEVAPLATMSAATLNHYKTHSPASRTRMALLVSALSKRLAGRSKNQSLRVIELGATSSSFSSKLAALTLDHKATLSIIEPQDKLRGALELTFEETPWVSVFSADNDALALDADIIISASGQLFDTLHQQSKLHALLAEQVAKGCHLVAIERAPSTYSDFVFGQTEGWFDNSATLAFPTGKLATSAQWTSLLSELGFQQKHVNEFDFAEGSFIAVEALSPSRDLARDSATTISSESILVLKGAETLAGADPLPTLSFSADETAETLAAKIDAAGGPPAQALYVVDGCDKNPSACLQDHILRLSALAGYLQQRQDQGLSSGAAPLRLLIVSHGGAPTANDQSEGVASGIWSFARVLQNEYDIIDLHLLDADPADPLTLEIAADLLNKGPANREWAVSPESGEVEEIRVVRGTAALRNHLTKDYEAAFITQKVASRVDSIIWQKGNIPQPNDDDVVVEVAATGLNFRDVMWAMGLLPEEALEDGFAGATIGMEFSGTVTATGKNACDIAIGQKVMGIGPAAFGTHVRVNRAGVTAVPEGLDLRAAASVPVAFLTAHYALANLGRIRAGDTILIHGAAGGVGLAAVQIAQLKGAKIIATAGTPEKRNFLAMLGVEHIFDSRSLSFVDDVLKVTDGEGVELVLNSLFSEAMERSIELLKPFGRFLELGKRDYYADRKIGLRPFRRNISYFGIDADQLLIHEPALTAEIFTQLSALFAQSALSPLPYRCFDYNEIGQAFRLMQNAGHIGKIIVTPPVAGRDKVAKEATRRAFTLSDGVCLVVGGIGGFGLAAANWLAAKGAKHIALSSRSGTADEETLAAIEAWETLGITASLHACDVTNETALSALLAELRQIGPLVGVLHAAMVLDDALINNLNRQRNRPVIDTKVRGAQLLDRLTRQDPIELFFMFSSATTMVGNPGQSNYVAANGYLEGLARQRRQLGRPALAVGFGAIADKGFLARNAEVGDVLAKRIGKKALTAHEALRLVDSYITTSSATAVDQAVVMISELDLAAASALTITRQPLFSAVAKQGALHSGGSDDNQIDLAALIAGKSGNEALALIHSFLAGEIGTILRVGQDSVTPDKVLKDIGLDSLMAMELGMSLQQKTGLEISLSGLNDGTTVGDVTRKIHEKLGRSTEENGPEVARPSEGLIEKLIVQHGGAAAASSAQMVGQNG